MPKLVLERISKWYGRVEAVHDVDLTIDDKEFTILVGPSGCGKSTVLRIIAGLEEPSGGRVLLGDRDVTGLRSKDRDIAMVFQDYALYPHMSVYDNMAFGLTLRKSPREEVEQRVRQAAEMLGLGGLLGRKPRELSGGQRQRVALGRAIVRKPSLFLFDEPLSNLDAELRVGMRTELAKLHQKLQTTSVFVTHDQVEAMTMGTKIVVMKDGLVQQTGRPLDVFNRPVNQFVAGFIGSPKMNFIPARLIPAADGLALVANGITLAVPAERVASYGPHVGSEVVLGIRPADIHDRRYAPDAVRRHVISATVDIVEPLGSEAHVYCRAEGTEFMAVLGIQTSYRPQQGIELVFDMTRMHLFASHGDNHRIDVQSAPLRVVNLS